MSELERARELLAPVFARLGIDAPTEGIVEELYLPLARRMAALRREKGRAVVLGVQGAQGAGKSTLAEALRVLGEGLHGLRVACLSLDDLYLTRRERERLAREVHPLLRTRGVPGTHDVGMGLRVIGELAAATEGDGVSIPRFDKGTDDRAPEEVWERWEGPCDVLVFEGWCVGVEPQGDDALEQPVNALEAEEDPDGVWRRYVDAQLRGPYRPLWARVDELVRLPPLSMDEILARRILQERKLAASRGPTAPATMTDAQLARFILLFERWTTGTRG